MMDKKEMDEEIRTVLKKQVEKYILLFPHKFSSQNIIPENQDDLLDLLVQFFTKEEQDARMNSNEIYGSEIRGFAKSFMRSLNPYHILLEGNEKYKELCGKMHVAYGYFCQLNEAAVLGSGERSFLDAQYEKVLYWGLVDFFQCYTTNFYDNEEAIELLCKFYPERITDELKEEAELIVDTLYIHVSRAGTPNDYMYAYNGIQMIEKYIGKLPKDIIIALIKKYNIYGIKYNKVFRHQLLTIINCAGFDEEIQTKLKFWCLDSLQIVYTVNILFVQKLTAEKTEAEFHEDYNDLTLSDKEIRVFSNLPLYWNNDFPENWSSDFVVDRTLFNFKEPIIRITLQEDGVTVFDEKKRIPVKFEYDKNDWLLENYQEKEQREKLRLLVLETSSTSKNCQVTGCDNRAFFNRPVC